MKHNKGKLDLYLAHRSALVDYARPIVGCRARAEDIVQDAYLQFSAANERKRVSGEVITHPVGYLYRTVRNLALNWLRRQTSEGTAFHPDMLENLVSATPTPEHEVLCREELQRVAAALAELPERTRWAFELHRLHGQTLQQVASALGISVGLAHQLVRDALTHCAGRLGDGN